MKVIALNKSMLLSDPHDGTFVNSDYLTDALGIELPDDYPATATIRKDLETLRDYGILDKRMYRWGYYLVHTGASSPTMLSRERYYCKVGSLFETQWRLSAPCQL
jgi:hypothetical protein